MLKNRTWSTDRPDWLWFWAPHIPTSLHHLYLWWSTCISGTRKKEDRESDREIKTKMRETTNLMWEKKRKEKCKVIVTMYIYTVTVANVQICTFIHPLVWEVLEHDCVNFIAFFIIEELMWMLLEHFYCGNFFFVSSKKF